MTAYRPDAVIGCKLKQNANDGCNSCASPAGLVLCFIACFILLVIVPYERRICDPDGRGWRRLIGRDAGSGNHGTKWICMATISDNWVRDLPRRWCRMTSAIMSNGGISVTDSVQISHADCCCSLCHTGDPVWGPTHRRWSPEFNNVVGLVYNYRNSLSGNFTGDAKNVLNIEEKCHFWSNYTTKCKKKSADVDDNNILVVKFIVLILLIKK